MTLNILGQDKKKKKTICLKINPDIDAAIRSAAQKHGLRYIDIIEAGAQTTAARLLKRKPLISGGENEK